MDQLEAGRAFLGLQAVAQLSETGCFVAGSEEKLEGSSLCWAIYDGDTACLCGLLRQDAARTFPPSAPSRLIVRGAQTVCSPGRPCRSEPQGRERSRCRYEGLLRGRVGSGVKTPCTTCGMEAMPADLVPSETTPRAGFPLRQYNRLEDERAIGVLDAVLECWHAQRNWG